VLTLLLMVAVGPLGLLVITMSPSTDQFVAVITPVPNPEKTGVIVVIEFEQVETLVLHCGKHILGVPGPEVVIMALLDEEVKFTLTFSQWKDGGVGTCAFRLKGKDKSPIVENKVKT
jgi:hypothetical protein